MTDSDMEQAEPAPGRGSRKCGARKRQGEGHCGKPEGWGTPNKTGRCSLHGGNTPSHRKTAAREKVEKEVAAAREKAEKAVATYGLAREIEPAEALLEEVWRTAGHVSWISDRIKELEEPDLIWGITEEANIEASEFGGINRKSAATPHVWLELYARERKHLVDVCKATISAGVAERQVKLAERMGGQLAQVMQSIFVRMGLDPNDPKLLEAISAEFGGLATAT